MKETILSAVILCSFMYSCSQAKACDKIYELETLVIEIEKQYGEYVLTENIKKRVKQLVEAHNSRKPALGD